jgi:hypothetical protein
LNFLISTGYGPSVVNLKNNKMASSTLRDVGHIEKLNGRNFPQWKFGVWLLLEHCNLVPLVEGTEELPEEV